MGKREEKKQALRTQLLETSIKLFRERGVDQTRVRDVVSLVGVTEKTFFNYFASKDAVLEAYALDQLELYLALLRHQLAAQERPVIERLTQIMSVFAASQTTDRDFQGQIALRSGIFFGATGTMRQRQKDGQLLLAELFAEGQRRGELRPDLDALHAAELLTAVMSLTTVNWLTKWWPTVESLEVRLMRALDVFLRGSATSTREKPRSRRGQAT
jgi:AcrR family transcriptional regulator